MKLRILLFLAAALICGCFAVCTKGNCEEYQITPQYIDSCIMLNMRSFADKTGGSLRFNDGKINLRTKNVRAIMQSGKKEALVNGLKVTLPAAPKTVNGKSFIPIVSVSAVSAFDALYNSQSRAVTVKSGAAKKPNVYIIHEITPMAMIKVYRKLGFDAGKNVGIKLSTGEAGNPNYLSPHLIKPLVQGLKGTIVECNTAYGGQRSDTADHLRVAKDHGFTDIAKVDIMDAEGSLNLPIDLKNPLLPKGNLVGSHLSNYKTLVVLSHFKGHAMAGFGGAIKNISIGIASVEGKLRIHSGGKSDSSFAGGTQEDFLRAMAEAAYSVVNYYNGNMVYINVMNNLSEDCDCDSHPAEAKMKDVGILASNDPVALDQACIDIVYKTDRTESGALIERIESRKGLITLDYAEKINLGSKECNLISLD